MGAIHQFVPTLEPGAIGAHSIEIAKLCDELGVPNEIWAEHLRWDGRGRLFGEYPAAARPGAGCGPAGAAARRAGSGSRGRCAGAPGRRTAGRWAGTASPRCG